MVMSASLAYFSSLGDETLAAIRFLHGTRSRLLQAFERELLTLLPRLRRFARALAREPADADDLLQVALERALKAREQWTPGTRLDSWMMKIVRNCWIDEVRSRARRARTFLPEEEGAAVGADTHREIEARVEMHAVDKAMNALSAEQREVIALVLVEGLAYREAAELLDIPMGTLTSRLTRGRQALVQILELEAA
jgi:RNA polymerase sigma-70 factor (ECF subfamily)